MLIIIFSDFNVSEFLPLLLTQNFSPPIYKYFSLKYSTGYSPRVSSTVGLSLPYAIHSLINTTYPFPKRSDIPDHAKSSVTSPLFWIIDSTSHLPTPSSCDMSKAASRGSTTEVLVRLSSISESLSLAQAHKPITDMAIIHSPVIPLQILFRNRGGGKTLSIKQKALHSHIITISFQSFNPNRFSYFSCKSNIFLRNQQINPQKFCWLRIICYFCSGIMKYN